MNKAGVCGFCRGVVRAEQVVWWLWASGADYLSGLCSANLELSYRLTRLYHGPGDSRFRGIRVETRGLQ